jgi:hypothetical protein
MQLHYQKQSISVPKSIIEKNFSLPDTELVKVSKMELLKLAEEWHFFLLISNVLLLIEPVQFWRSYKICCKLKPEYAFYWYDLGITYFYQYKSNHLVDSNAITFVLAKSKECLINAINLDASEPLFWNMMGILYATNGFFNFFFLFVF